MTCRVCPNRFTRNLDFKKVTKANNGPNAGTVNAMQAARRSEVVAIITGPAFASTAGDVYIRLLGPFLDWWRTSLDWYYSATDAEG